MKRILFIIALVINHFDLYAQNKVYGIDDLILISKSQFGFVKADGTINEYYGDFEYSSEQKMLFEFNLGCGRSGDIVSLIVKLNPIIPNNFDLFIPKGGILNGKPTPEEKKVGTLILLSELEFKGNIKLCLEKGASCCGEEGENFTIRRIK
jgi:hypothetical protein